MAVTSQPSRNTLFLFHVQESNPKPALYSVRDSNPCFQIESLVNWTNYSNRAYQEACDVISKAFFLTTHFRRTFNFPSAPGYMRI